MQFTLRHLFVCVTCFCVGLALLVTEVRLQPSGLVGFLCAFVAATVVGAGLGYLFDTFWAQVFFGTLTAVVIFNLWLLESFAFR